MNCKNNDDDADYDDFDLYDDGNDDVGDDTLPCPFCEEEIYEDCDVCPHCGNYVFMDRAEAGHPVWSGRPKWWRILGFIGVIATILALSGIGVAAFLHLLNLLLFGN